MEKSARSSGLKSFVDRLRFHCHSIRSSFSTQFNCSACFIKLTWTKKHQHDDKPERTILQSDQEGSKCCNDGTQSFVGAATIRDNNHILRLELECLDPKSVALSKQVCNQWKDGVNSHCWKSTAKNIKPQAFHASYDATKDNKNNRNLDFEAMGIGLTKLTSPYLAPSKYDSYLAPTIKAEDIYVLVEVEDGRTTHA